MVLSALPLFSVVFLLTGQTEKIKKDSQIKTFLSYWLGAILLVLIYRLATGAFTDTYSLITNTVFNISSIATTTGLSNENYELWGKAVSAIFFFIMALGGCAGSTSGGIKAFRINILFKSLIRHIKTKLSPHAIFVPKFNQEPVSDETILNISGFLVLWLSCFVVLSFLLSLSGVDFETALSGVLTGITNTGPGIGKTIGPVGNFSSLTGYGKAIMCLSMMLGRLEFLTLIVLFLPSTWKRK
ncbi:MAG: TrkH family potassium uptake protein [Alphaproteobacteria bacterium]|nr:TrkH family potassium uptake protein [Alphaproteobacteria bacterium]